MKQILCMAFLILAGGPAIVLADLKTGQGALDRSDYATALRELRPLAERGNAEAQFLLGKMYSFGWGVKDDKEEAARWYGESARQGYPKARQLLVKMCERDSTPEKVRAANEKLKAAKPDNQLREGRSLCFKAARQLEQRLEADPTELVSRYRLLGYYYFAAPSEIGAPKTVEARRRHVLWLIEHQPESDIAGSLEAGIAPVEGPLGDAQGYAEGSRLWLQHLESRTATAVLFSHAARYHQVHDKAKTEQILLRGKEKFPVAAPDFDAQLGYTYAMAVLGVSRLNHTGIPIAASPEEAASAFATKARKTLEQSSNATLVGIAGKILSQYGTMMLAMGTSKTGEMKLAERLLSRAEKLQPDNPSWAEMLGQHLQTLAKLGPKAGGDASTLRRALGYMEKSLAQTSAPDWRMDRLREVAKLAFKVGDYVKAERYAKELLTLADPHPQDEKYGAAWHDGHVVLGRLALKNKSPATAGEHLLKAGKTVGGSTLTSFGPNMGLAKDLLEQGEKQVVIDYLRLCKNFWTGPRTPIDRWIQEIESGHQPEFGANLEY